GYPLEDNWPYNVKEFATKPPEALAKPALREQVKRYEQVARDLNEFKEVLSEGFPIVLGFTVFPSIYNAEVSKTGVIPLPQKGETREGGHAILVCGYDDEKEALIIRNSWGENWGDGGYGYLPYGYITDKKLSANFWTIG
ncbi:MAG: peptidase, partial [Proteobacteria bacterium]